MGKTRQHDMFDFFQLIADGGVDSRIGMPEQIDLPRTDGIEVAIAISIVQPYTLTTRNRYQRVLFVLFHLRARMPYRLQASLLQMFQ